VSVIRAKRPADRGRSDFSRARPGASWDERCSVLFEDLRKPARVMVARAYGGALSSEEVEDVYGNAWASTLAALRGRERRLDDEELRSYLLTAVANHASKEMRRRSRKPTSELREAHAQTVSDAHQPSPEELAVGAEAGAVVRDVLSSLPARRRAVILLRYGWGLEPAEICGLVSNLSPRAYRKEITRGIGEVIERLRQVESGAWCRSREPMIRDHVAGVATGDCERQALQHIDHCRQCSELVARLQGHLHELGGAIAWTSLAGAVGERHLATPERLLGLLDRGRDAAQGAADRGLGEAAIAVGSGGGARGAGAAGVGALAKLAGLGAAGKAAVACLGAGVAASACVAAGVVPGIGAGEGSGDGGPRPAAARPAAAAPAPPLSIPSAPADAIRITGSADPVPIPPASGEGGAGDRGPNRERAERQRTAPEGAPADSPAPGAPPEQQEFGLPAAGPSSGATASSAGPAGASAGSGGAAGTGGAASGGDVAREFGP
jgi:RNA polymerase sigma factor (sigma-70 family)